ncbi:Zn(2)-C6 fungal-type domain-containing protein [Fusarium keratoplasticum]|nr:Zn(2)-C6 fungal-type domain-containing protein [Fusarium keratoplasticum]
MAPSSRPLLPRPASDKPRIGSRIQGPPLFKPPKTRTACHHCRKRKVKCGGQRPTCRACIQRELKCEYPIEKGEVLEAGFESRDLVARLRSLPYDQALELFQHLREGQGSSSSAAGESSTPAGSQGSSIPPSIPDTFILRSCMPGTPNSLEFELAIRHPIAYPTLYPIPIASLPPERMIRPTRAIQSPSTSPSAESGDSPQQDIIPPTPSSSAAQSPTTLLIHDGLKQLDITYWTDVPISNELAGRVISLYLEIDYPVLPLFHADLFVQDLVQRRGYFCSRFLVSALLSWACQAYTALKPEVATYSVEFFSEAERCLAAMPSANTLTAVSALQLLCMSAVTQGRDDVALRYLQESVRVGRTMGLFGVQPGRPSANSWLVGYHDWRIAASYTAWGVFNWVSVHGLHYQRAEIEIPPQLPMPGDVEFTPDMQGVYSAHPDPQKDTFRACCQLWVIFHQVLWSYYGQRKTGVPSQRVPIEFAEGIYRRLLTWADDLPLNLVRSDLSNHGVMMMHIYFHAIVTDIFRPLLTDAEMSKPLRLGSFTAPKATPEAAYLASVNQLKRLLLMYRLNFRTAMFSVVWQTGLIYVANAMMREVKSNSNEWRYYLYLCMAGLEDLYASYRVFGSIAKAILGIAIEHGALRTSEARRITNELEDLGRHHTAIKPLGDGREVANWVIDLDLAMTDPKAAQGSNLAERFQELIIEDPPDQSQS